MNQGKRLDKLEEIVATHLQESGEIRADLRWLKKFVWILVASPMIPEIMRHIWR